ncbi:unnamed protein product [Ostreobium quekettii]|uniref:HMG box domain-containing protein n=1 Tax=Ostreobium quekettii TaxID=121088 RepID=A0A8S1JBG1_9CHLO|nr:unnamed protein product [Ostreobium quekettii]|eukprot:evm.model.scf_1397.2 EVM.evm.TU.scf_1397.2   scf_1397:12409-16297(-)
MDGEQPGMEESMNDAQGQGHPGLAAPGGGAIGPVPGVAGSAGFPVPFLVTSPLGPVEGDVAAMVAAAPPAVEAIDPMAPLAPPHPPLETPGTVKRGKKPHADQSGAGAPPKRQRAKKPADSPRRPKSAYMFFLAEFRQQWKKDNPDSKKVADVAKAAGEAWRGLAEDQKAKYEVQSSEDKAQYATAMEAYNQEHPKPHRRAKKERDPAEIKKPQSAYFFFLADFRDAYKREHPGDQPQVALMGKLAGDKWKSMTPEERAPYEQMSSASKEQYKRLKSMTPDQRMAVAATVAMQALPSAGPSSVIGPGSSEPTPTPAPPPPPYPVVAAAPAAPGIPGAPVYPMQDEAMHMQSA